MRLFFTVPDTPQTQNGVLLRNFLRQCAVSTDLARAVKFRGSSKLTVCPGYTLRLARTGSPSAKKPLPRNFTARDRSVETLHLRRKPRSSIPSASGGTLK